MNRHSPKMTRRAMLQAGAGAGAALILGAHVAAAEEKDKSADLKKGFIDAHVHVWTPDTDKYPLAKGFTKDDVKPPSFTPEELLALARPCGVTRITLIQMSFGSDRRATSCRYRVRICTR